MGATRCNSRHDDKTRGEVQGKENLCKVKNIVPELPLMSVFCFLHVCLPVFFICVKTEGIFRLPQV